MKRLGLLLGVLILGAFVVLAQDASAQQRPTPVPATTHGSSIKPDRPLPPLHFPTTAATYEAYVQFYLKMLREAGVRYHVDSGDTNKAILLLRDCASRVEADGYVTRNEARACHRQTMAMVHEIATPYMMQYAAEN